MAVGLPFPPDQRAGLFVETYAVAAAGGGDAVVVVDGGATFAASPDVQLDVRIGRGGQRDVANGRRGGGIHPPLSIRQHGGVALRPTPSYGNGE